MGQVSRFVSGPVCQKFQDVLKNRCRFFLIDRKVHLSKYICVFLHEFKGQIKGLEEFRGYMVVLCPNIEESSQNNIQIGHH